MSGRSVRETTRPERERGAVVAWRRRQLVRSGFPQRLAVSVARDLRFDLHALVELAEHGCAPELAVRIVAPLGEDEAA